MKMDELKAILVTRETFPDGLSARSDFHTIKKYDMTLSLPKTTDEQKSSKYIDNFD